MKQANLSTNAMKKLKVVLPGEEEQSEIAACFKSLEQKVVAAGRKRRINSRTSFAPSFRN